MTRDRILQALREILHSVGQVDPAQVNEDQAFVADLGLDSLVLVKLAVNAEDVFGITIPEEDVWKLRTVADAVSYVQDNLGQDCPARDTTTGHPGPTAHQPTLATTASAHTSARTPSSPPAGP